MASFGVHNPNPNSQVTLVSVVYLDTNDNGMSDFILITFRRAPYSVILCVVMWQ